jgi:hypothetical protein
MDPHVLVMLEEGTVADVPGVPVAGVMLCPQCDCTMTWSVDGWPEPALPASWEIEILRWEAFGG